MKPRSVFLPVRRSVRFVGIGEQVETDRTTLRQIPGVIVNQHVGADLSKDHGFAEFAVPGVIRMVNPRVRNHSKPVRGQKGQRLLPIRHIRHDVAFDAARLQGRDERPKRVGVLGKNAADVKSNFHAGKLLLAV